MAKINDILVPSITLEEILSDGSTLSNPAADHRRLFLGEDGLLHLRDSAGTVTDVGSGVGGGATPHVYAEAVADVNITNASTWYDVLSVSLTAGTWLLFGQMRMSSTNNCWLVARLAYGAGRTQLTTRGQFSGTAALTETHHIQARRVASGSETVYLQGWTDSVSGSPRAVARYQDAYGIGTTTTLYGIQVS